MDTSRYPRRITEPVDSFQAEGLMNYQKTETCRSRKRDKLRKRGPNYKKQKQTKFKKAKRTVAKGGRSVAGPAVKSKQGPTKRNSNNDSKDELTEEQLAIDSDRSKERMKEFDRIVALNWGPRSPSPPFHGFHSEKTTPSSSPPGTPSRSLSSRLVFVSDNDVSTVEAQPLFGEQDSLTMNGDVAGEGPSGYKPLRNGHSLSLQHGLAQHTSLSSPLSKETGPFDSPDGASTRTFQEKGEMASCPEEAESNSSVTPIDNLDVSDNEEAMHIDMECTSSLVTIQEAATANLVGVEDITARDGVMEDGVSLLHHARDADSEVEKEAVYVAEEVNVSDDAAKGSKEDENSFNVSVQSSDSLHSTARAESGDGEKSNSRVKPKVKAPSKYKSSGTKNGAKKKQKPASSIFVYEDPPDVVKLMEQDTGPGFKKHKRSVTKGGRADSTVSEEVSIKKPVVKQKPHRKKKDTDGKNNDTDVKQTNINQFLKLTPGPSTKSKPESIPSPTKRESDEDSAPDEELKDNYVADIDELLKMPERPSDGSKTVDEFLKPTPGPSTKSKPESIPSPTKRESDEDSEEELKEKYVPDLDELLKMPERPADGSKTEDERCDEMDILIAERQRAHEEEMEKVDIDIEEMKRKRTEKKARMKENALRRNILQANLTESKLRELFKENLDHLQGVWDGKVESSRHKAFHQSIRTRHALYYMMITDPFTDEQLDWTMDEIEKVWGKTKKQAMDNKDYIWRVLISECFIKFYMDFFQVSKDQAVQMISETPLHKKDRLKEMKLSDESDETDSD